jgi:hypothetical protein
MFKLIVIQLFLLILHQIQANRTILIDVRGFNDLIFLDNPLGKSLSCSTAVHGLKFQSANTF